MTAAVGWGGAPAEVSLHGARVCYNESAARGRARRANRPLAGLMCAGCGAVLRAAGVVRVGVGGSFAGRSGLSA